MHREARMASIAGKYLRDAERFETALARLCLSYAELGLPMDRLQSLVQSYRQLERQAWEELAKHTEEVQ